MSDQNPGGSGRRRGRKRVLNEDTARANAKASRAACMRDLRKRRKAESRQRREHVLRNLQTESSDEDVEEDGKIIPVQEIGESDGQEVLADCGDSAAESDTLNRVDQVRPVVLIDPEIRHAPDTTETDDEAGQEVLSGHERDDPGLQPAEEGSERGEESEDPLDFLPDFEPADEDEEDQDEGEPQIPVIPSFPIPYALAGMPNDPRDEFFAVMAAIKAHSLVSDAAIEKFLQVR